MPTAFAASAASSPSSPAPTAAFEPDDADTLSLLLSPSPSSSPDDDEIRTRLTSFANRFRIDFAPSPNNNGNSALSSASSEERYWDNLADAASDLGLDAPDSSLDYPDDDADDNSGHRGHASAGLVAFQSVKGKAHLRAVASLLGVSERRAVGLTLAALRSLADDGDHDNDDDDDDNTAAAAAAAEEKKDDSGRTTKPRPNLRTLLGTRNLLSQTLSHHHTQRTLRLQILTESLRIEQDGTHPNHDAVAEMLDSLDYVYELDGKRRGLMRTLIGVACGGEGGGGRVPGREGLMLGAELYDSESNSSDYSTTTNGSNSSTFGGGNSSAAATEHNRRSYAKSTLRSFQHQNERERTSSLEALLVLLYDRIDGGVNRFDYAILVLALGSRSRVENDGVGDDDGGGGGGGQEGRWSKLAGLVMAEAAALWRATSPTSPSPSESQSNPSSWVTAHPLLTDLLSPDPTLVRGAVSELNALGKLVRGFGDGVLGRRARANRNKNKFGDEEDDDDYGGGVEAPESISLLSYGLLLRLAGLSAPTVAAAVAGSASDSTSSPPLSPASTLLDVLKTLRDGGTELVGIANDECGAFAYLHRVMVSLLPPPPSSAGLSSSGGDGDAAAGIDDEDDEFPTLPEGETMLLADDGANDEDEGGDDAASVAYASIGREILCGTVSAFRSTLLATGGGTTPEANLGMLCNLASVIYRNSSALCDVLWSDWDGYCAARAACAAAAAASDGTTIPEADPVCHLLDAAYALASRAVANALGGGGGASSSSSSQGTTVSDGLKCADILPSLAPLSRLTSALVPPLRQRQEPTATATTPTASDVLSSFLPEGTVHAALLGCASVYADGFCYAQGEVAMRRRDAVENGAVEVLTSLATLARLGGGREGEAEADGCSVLRAALEPPAGSVDVGGVARRLGPGLLHLIASRAVAAAAAATAAAATTESRSKSSKRADELAAAALDVIATLVRSPSADSEEGVAWTVQACRSFGQTRTGGGGFGPFVTPAAVGSGDFLTNGGATTLAAMNVLGALSSQLDRVAFTGTVDDAQTADFLSTVGNGLLVALGDVLPSTTLATADGATRRHSEIIRAVLASLRHVLTSVGGMIATHSSPDVRGTAKTVRDGLVNVLSTSTAIGNALAYYATLPVSISFALEVERYIRSQVVYSNGANTEHDDAEDGGGSGAIKKKYGAWANLVQNAGGARGGNFSNSSTRVRSFVDGLARNIHAVPLVDLFGPNYHRGSAGEASASTTMRNAALSAMAVLRLWGEHAESMTLERHGYDSSYGNGLSIEDAVGSVQPLTGKSMASDLQAVSPQNLLLSLAPNPFRSSSLSSQGGGVSIERSFRGCGITNLNLLSRYLSASGSKSRSSVHTEAKSTPDAHLLPFSTGSIALIAMTLRQTDAAAALVAGGGSRPGGIGVAKALGGEQLHKGLLVSLKMAVEASENAPADRRFVHMAARLVDLLTLCIEAQPVLARAMLSGCDTDTKSDNMGVVKLMAKSVKDIVQASSQGLTPSLERKRLASSCLDAFAVLWTACRCRSQREGGGSDTILHPCDIITKDIVIQTDVLSDCGALLLSHASLVGRETDAAYLRGNALSLNLLSNALEILANEILLRIHRDASDDGDGVGTFMKKIAAGNAVEEWSMAFTSFSGAAASAECLSELLKNSAVSRVNLDATRFVGLHSSPGRLESNEKENIRQAISTMKFISHESSSAAIVEDLVRYYYLEKVSNSQLALIKCWSRFAQVYSSSVMTDHSLDQANVLSSATNLVTPPPRGRSVTGGGSNEDATTLLLTVLSMAESTLDALQRNSTLAITVSSSSYHVVSSSCLAGTMGCHLSSLLAQILDEFYTLVGSKETAGLPELNSMIDMLDRLHQTSATLFSITKPSQPALHGKGRSDGAPASSIDLAQTRAYRIGCHLRLRLLTCSLLLVRMVEDEHFSSLSGTSDSSPALKQQKRFHSICVGFAGLAADALDLLQHSPSPKEAASVALSSARFGYSFDVGVAIIHDHHESSTLGTNAGAKDLNDGLALALLRVSISVLTVVVAHSANTPAASSLHHAFAFTADLADCLQQSGAIPSLLRHLDAASRVAATAYMQNNEGIILSGQSLHSKARVQDNALDVVTRIIALLEHASSCSSGIALPMLLTEQHIVRYLTECPLLHTSCGHWYTLTAPETVEEISDTLRFPRRHLRGYIPPAHDTLAGTTTDAKGTRNVCREDHVHGIWRAVMRTLSALLRSFRINDSPIDRGLEKHHVQCLNGLVDFLSAYDGAILSCLYSCSFVGRTSQAPAQAAIGRTNSLLSSPATSSSAVTFTSNNLEEAADALSLVSELCTGEHRKFFESTCPELYQKMINASLNVTRSLTSFLGSVGTARELFSALSSLNKAMEENSAQTGEGGVDESSAAVNAAMEIHPLLSEGIPSARHEAIRNAHFASSVCVCMTAEDYALSLEASNVSDTASNVGIATSTSNVSLEQSFQIHVNNRFIVRIEKVASQCLFDALSVLAKTHPASSSFIFFTEAEASRLDAMPLVQQGMIIALRPPKGALLSGNNNLELRYARVMNSDILRQSWDVEYLPSDGSVSRGVSASLLAGMEDLTNRRCIFAYAPAPRLSSDEVEAAMADVSIGHLILALRWCHQQATVQVGTGGNPDSAVSKSFVQCLAERTVMLLGLEVTLDEELGVIRAASADVVRKINAQLLELFDEDVMRSLDVTSPLAGDGADALRRGPKRGLKIIIDDEVWAAVTAQLSRELQAARYDREEALKQWNMNTGGTLGGNPAWGGNVRMGRRRSPFRGSSFRSLSL